MQEDVQILSFAEQNKGRKWSRLTKLMSNRNQHCLKNRFFTLLACATNIPIRKIRMEKQYLKTSMISEALAYHQKFVAKPKPVVKIEHDEIKTE